MLRGSQLAGCDQLRRLRQQPRAPAGKRGPGHPEADEAGSAEDPGRVPGRRVGARGRRAVHGLSWQGRRDQPGEGQAQGPGQHVWPRDPGRARPAAGREGPLGQMSKKKVRAILKLELQAGRATPAPPVGTALGPHGINIMEITKAYNERTQAQAGDVVPAEITIFEDRTFTFVLKTPPTVNLLKRAAAVEKGSAKPNRDKVGRVTKQQ